MDIKCKLLQRIARKTAFSQFVKSKEFSVNMSNIKESASKEDTWICCEHLFSSLKEIHRHVSTNHMLQVFKITQDIFEHGDVRECCFALKNDSGMKIKTCISMSLPIEFRSADEYEWLPILVNDNQLDSNGQVNEGRILLFYHYRAIGNTLHIKMWQQELCMRLNLHGKIRVAEEGLNATVGGSWNATEIYMKCVLSHPLFSDMDVNQFKTSMGFASDFPDGLKVGIFKEAVPMGIDPETVSFNDAGKHLKPEEFHRALQVNETKPDSIFIDCRNFYESKIGKFEGAVCPDIRKFSYWPEYVDANIDVFKDKNVYMYCTGGIRCERGSAYLKTKGICKDIFQLEGGVHKYIEMYPDGFFRGKLFVFDNRYHIKANNDILAECVYCNKPWDEYESCSSSRCHQLVLSCPHCRHIGLTACCKNCQCNNEKNVMEECREQCDCTLRRPRIPADQLDRFDDPHKTQE